MSANSVLFPLPDEEKPPIYMIQWDDLTFYNTIIKNISSQDSNPPTHKLHIIPIMVVISRPTTGGVAIPVTTLLSTSCPGIVPFATGAIWSCFLGCVGSSLTTPQWQYVNQAAVVSTTNNAVAPSNANNRPIMFTHYSSVGTSAMYYYGNLYIYKLNS